MKVSLKWLQDYINLADFAKRPELLVEKLTAAGLEVESVVDLSRSFDSVVVGEILERGAHPNSQKLTLCQVATGEGVLHQIVCGAQNHKVGDRVLVALPGAVLPGGLVIQPTEIRGVSSAGMLCSAKELGLEDRFGATEGIVILDRQARLGQSLAEFAGLDDIVLEVKVTPNRADCLSHYGMARELSCLTGATAQMPQSSLSPSRGGPSDTLVDVKLLEPGLCPRYCAQVIAGVEIGPSPTWLKQRLESVGLKSINNVVDATNFVMMELGQPMHAFDLDRLQGARIEVGLAKPGETLTTLDGTELKFSGDELVIRDGRGPVALAGAIGGLDSGVQPTTKRLVIESAYFSPASVRRTARRLGVETDSAYRFARGVNIEAVPVALRRCAEIICRVAGGELVGDSIDLYPQPFERQLIGLSQSFVESKLGLPVEWSQVCEVMRQIGCERVEDLESRDKQGKAKFRPPLFRVDISMDVDLVEEFARLQGYGKLKETLPPTSVAPLGEDAFATAERRVRAWLKRDALQAVNYAFVHSAFHDRLLGDRDHWAAVGLRLESDSVRLVNPLNEELDILRQSLLPGLVRNVSYNTRNGNPVGRLFETGFAHFRNSDHVEARYQQRARVGFAFWGQSEGLWQKRGSTGPLVFDLKSVVERWLRSQGLQVEFEVLQPEGDEIPETFHPKRVVAVAIEGKRIGVIGELHPLHQENEKIRTEVALAEVDLDAVFGATGRGAGGGRYQPISRWPKIERDLALVMPKAMESQVVVASLHKSAGPLLRSVETFDVYEGHPLAENQKSLAVRLTFQAQDRTLEDAEVAEAVQASLGHLKESLGLELRA